ncbi:MAG: hypothetical protein IT337_12980 [Thermomicrobiales bacterium]|nr:hypothetical protein [Thermomicrobiales bacterium]
MLVRWLIPLALALGLLAAPVECHLAAGPHSLFQNPVAVAALAEEAGSRVHADAVAPAADMPGMGAPMAGGADAARPPAAAPADPDDPRLSPMTAPVSSPAPALLSTPATPQPGDAAGLLVGSVFDSLGDRARPAPEPPPPQIVRTLHI